MTKTPHHQVLPSAQDRASRDGVALATVTYAIWGLVPVYMRMLRAIPLLDTLSYRLIWSLLLLLPVMIARGQVGTLLSLARRPRRMGIFLLAGVVLSLNWAILLWAINHGHAIEASLGYFVTPLINVACGVLFFRERMRPAQCGALAIAIGAVSYLAWFHGGLPVIALTLALTFTGYGVIKKRIEADPMAALTLETAAMTLPAIAALVLVPAPAGPPLDARTMALLAGAGLLTVVPLASFAAAAQRISLSLLGVLQYITPLLQLAMAVWVFQEPFPRAQMIAFGLFCASLAVFACEGAWWARRR